MTYLLNSEIKGSNDAAPTVVLVHGVAGSLHIWDPIFDSLAEDYTTIRFDLLGYGHSPKPRLRYTPSVHIAAIRKTLQVRGLKPPYALIGLSMGVTLVLDYAAEYPNEVATLVGIGYPYYPDATHAREGLRGNLWAGLTISHPAIAQVFIPTAWTLGRLKILPPGLFTKIYSPIMASDTLLNPYRVFRSNIWNSMVRIDAPAMLKASGDLPRLFIHGGDDAWSKPEVVQAAMLQFKNSRFELIPNAEHNLVVVRPKETLALIRDFLL